MTEKRRTFHVGPKGATQPIVLRNTAPRTWRAPDGSLFVHYGHSWLGQPGQRYRVEKWGAPHTDETFRSLQSALNAWARHAAPKKTAAQLDAEIAETLAHARVQQPHSLYKEPLQLRTTDTPPQYLVGYKDALARGKELRAAGLGWAAASLQAIADTYHVHSVNSESLGGDLRRVWKAIAEELRR